MKKSNRINILDLAKIQALLGFLIGLFCGFLYSFSGLILDVFVSTTSMISNETSGLSIGAILAFGALMGMSLIGLVFGFLLGLDEAVLYNLFSEWMSWVDLEIHLKFGWNE